MLLNTIEKHLQGLLSVLLDRDRFNAWHPSSGKCHLCPAADRVTDPWMKEESHRVTKHAEALWNTRRIILILEDLGESRYIQIGTTENELKGQRKVTTGHRDDQRPFLGPWPLCFLWAV